jgi:hypothetical protein
MEDHEMRRKIIREWMALPKDKRHTEQQVVAFAKKRRRSKTSSIAVDVIRTTNFGAIRTRKSWVGSYLALASRDERPPTPRFVSYEPSSWDWAGRRHCLPFRATGRGPS